MSDEKPPLENDVPPVTPDDDFDPVERINAIIDDAQPLIGSAETAPGDDEGDGAPENPSDELPKGSFDPKNVKKCAGLDHSDTDNGKRFLIHFGHDLVMMEQSGVAQGEWGWWTGTHWDIDGGSSGVRRLAQRVGALIALEASYLNHTPEEQAAVDAASGCGADDKELLQAAKDAVAALEKRKSARRKFGISSKNQARMENMIACAGVTSSVRKHPDAFNADPMKVATLSHTLRFNRDEDMENPDPRGHRYTVNVTAHEGHRQDDIITALVPVIYDPAASCPEFEAFMATSLPSAAKRECVQKFTGMGLLGFPMQYLMFHYGLGANGKSVFLETITRFLGPSFAVGLPRETIVGGRERAAGGASPDLARLFGKRMVRILEVKGGIALEEDLVKRLTGGEKFPVRTLFKGYFEFQNQAKPHMSGNDYPTIDGADHGIWRRMILIHWDQTVAEEARRDLEEMVSGFIKKEGPGILNWMIKGAIDYLANPALFIPDEVKAATAEYREEMDPVGEFIKACVESVAGEREAARMMYEAYVSWSMANSRRPKTEAKFGRVLKGYFKRDDGRVRHYLDCRLHDVPARPEAPARNPESG